MKWNDLVVGDQLKFSETFLDWVGSVAGRGFLGSLGRTILKNSNSIWTIAGLPDNLHNIYDDSFTITFKTPYPGESAFWSIMVNTGECWVGRPAPFEIAALKFDDDETDYEYIDGAVD